MQIIKKNNTENFIYEFQEILGVLLHNDLESFYILAWSGIEETLEFIT